MSSIFRIDGFVNKLTENGIDVNLGLVIYGDVNPPDNNPVVKEVMASVNVFKEYLSYIVPEGGYDMSKSKIVLEMA